IITGYLPSAIGRNTSARSTTPSSISIGASQSIFIPSRISDFISDASATVRFGGRGNANIEGGSDERACSKTPPSSASASRPTLGARPEPGQTALHFMRDAVVAALDDAG